MLYVARTLPVLEAGRQSTWPCQITGSPLNALSTYERWVRVGGFI
jgi:hypothetical protein